MEKSIDQVEKNVSASFAYVKKDMLMLNDAFSDLHDKMQHLSLNHAMLLEEIGKVRHEMAKTLGHKPAKAVDSEKKLKKKVKKSGSAEVSSKKTKKIKKSDKKKAAVKKVVKETETVTYE